MAYASYGKGPSLNEKDKKFKEEEMSDDSLAWVGWMGKEISHAGQRRLEREKRVRAHSLAFANLFSLPLLSGVIRHETQPSAKWICHF